MSGGSKTLFYVFYIHKMNLQSITKLAKHAGLIYSASIKLQSLDAL